MCLPGGNQRKGSLLIQAYRLIIGDVDVISARNVILIKKEWIEQAGEQ